MVCRADHNLETNQELFLDITAEVCPLTFVRTKLLIETLEPGQCAVIRLAGEEPLRNVPRAVQGLGHQVVSLLPEDAAAPPAGPHRLRIRKAPASP